MVTKEYSIKVGGKVLIAEFNDIADQANGSVIMRYGNTTVLVTAVMGNRENKMMNYFPLTVEYEEKFYAAGQILGSRYMRREGKPSDEAVLSGRIVDRTIRPLFEQWMRHEVQIIVTVLSIDQDDPDILAVIGASLALSTSNIPWAGPVSAVRIGNTNGEFMVNPTYQTRQETTVDLLVCGKDKKVNMIEVGSNEVSEDTVQSGLSLAIEEISKIQEWQEKIIKEIGKEKRVITQTPLAQTIIDLFDTDIAPKMPEYVMSSKPGKETIEELKEIWLDLVTTTLPEENAGQADAYFEEQVDIFIHKEALESERRPDGRTLDEVRPIFAKAGGIAPMLHGSGLFYRGQTHVLSALTLGGPGDRQIVEGMEEQSKKRFMHHYNFPPFSVGETGRVGGFNRRMIGHGALAEKALEPILPDTTIFPHTIRIVSEALASNGSTSMASVCGSSLALMDAGVPIKRPVAGIASGLMMNSKGAFKVLTDIQGPEDHYGDMDFKVAGTREGITAIQMDVKVSGVTLEILTIALEKAKAARLHILDMMDKEISEPRKELSPRAPYIISTKIQPNQIGMVIGPGGKIINEIREKTETEIDIEDDGTVFITGKKNGALQAKTTIEEMTRIYSVGERFTGIVVRIVDFGVFVTIGSNTEGLVHVSEIAPFRIDKVENVLSVGQSVPVVIKKIDEHKRIALSIKDADANFIKKDNGPTTTKAVDVTT